jgi:hypothetical protein
MQAMGFVLRTGCPWNALNATGIGSSSWAHRRFQEGGQAGVFSPMGVNGWFDYDAWCGIEWDWQAMDGAMTKAPLGGEKTGRCSSPESWNGLWSFVGCFYPPHPHVWDAAGVPGGGMGGRSWGERCASCGLEGGGT